MSNLDIEALSRRLDDVVVRSFVLLKGRVLVSRSFESFNDFMKTLEEVCRSGWCYSVLDLYKDGEKDRFEAYTKDGRIVGCILSLSDRKLYGLEALTELRVREASYTRVWATIYSFDSEVLKSLLGGIDIDIVGASPRAIEVPTPKPIETESRTKPLEGKDLRSMVTESLSRLGIEVLDVAVAEGEQFVVIDVTCRRRSSTTSLRELVFLVAKQVLLAMGTRKPLKITIHCERVYSEVVDVSNPDLVIVLGTIPEILARHGFGIDKLKYEVKNGRLDLRLVLRREGLYSSIGIEQLVRELYNELKKVWRGDLSIRAKIGAFGLEARAP